MLKLVLFTFSFNFEKKQIFPTLKYIFFFFFKYIFYNSSLSFFIHWFIQNILLSASYRPGFLLSTREALGKKKNPQKGLLAFRYVSGGRRLINELSYEVILENKCYKSGWDRLIQEATVQYIVKCRGHAVSPGGSWIAEITLWDYSWNQPLSFPHYIKCWWTSTSSF